MSDTMELDILPLGTVLLPGNRLSVPLVDGNSRDLVRGCWQDGSCFGLVYHNGSRLGRAGTRVKVLGMDSGAGHPARAVLAGLDRFVVERILPPSPSARAAVYFSAGSCRISEAVPPLRSSIIAMLRALAGHSAKPLDASLLERLDPVSFCMILGNTDLLDTEGRQTLLETEELEDRLEMILAAVRLSLFRMEALLPRDTPVPRPLYQGCFLN